MSKDIEYKGCKYVLDKSVNNVDFYIAENDNCEFDMLVMSNGKAIYEISTDNYYNASWIVINDKY
ncbi:MAG: hypothetical protein KIC84_11545 [Dysgonomonas mossii]|uniref:hypothetical protein n=1 Tax=Dysgonomonas mossii TaxID=163665 RepID=UPI0026ED81E1|nr:hypothetical protein [Dysgonomonas mossii]MBS5907848.1 hypothetical protein [Dysgonomonas mossii]